MGGHCGLPTTEKFGKWPPLIGYFCITDCKQPSINSWRPIPTLRITWRRQHCPRTKWKNPDQQFLVCPQVQGLYQVNHRQQCWQNGSVLVVLCGREEVGRFYAAFYSLGLSMCVNTKSHHDNYYCFKVIPDRSSFSVCWPHSKGFCHLVDNSHGAFHDMCNNNNTEEEFKIILVQEKGTRSAPNVLKSKMGKM